MPKTAGITKKKAKHDRNSTKSSRKKTIENVAVLDNKPPAHFTEEQKKHYKYIKEIVDRCYITTEAERLLLEQAAIARTLLVKSEEIVTQDFDDIKEYEIAVRKCITVHDLNIKILRELGLTPLSSKLVELSKDGVKEEETASTKAMRALIGS